MRENPTGCEDAFVIVRTWMATDNCGNVTTASQRIEVGDNTAPVLVGVPTDITVECDEFGNLSNTNEVTATDNCDDNVQVEVSDVQENPTGCEDAFVIVRTWTATDDCGNVTTATQRIEVGDNTAPTLVGVPADITLECDEFGALPAANDVEATDNCDDNVQVEVSDVQENPTGCEDAFVIVRTWTATDDCGNVTTESQRIEVGDNTAPILVGVPSSMTIECDEFGNIPNASDVTATDNCDDNVQVEITEVQENPTGCEDAFVITRTWIATDDCGNVTTAEQVIEVGDNTAPVLSGVPTDMTLECDELGNMTSTDNVLATDNCDDNVQIEVTEVRENPTGCEDAFVLSRTWTATDDCGNVTTATQRIEVGDNTAPVLAGVPSDISIDCDALGSIPNGDAVTATDNCDSNVLVEFSDIQEDAFGCENSFVIVRTWIATDDCGNATTAIQRIEVGDNTAPVLSGVPSDVTVECSEIGTITSNTANVTATDNCDDNVQIEVVENQEPLAGCENSFVIVRTWIATDNCGNSSTATQRIEAGDNTAPVLAGVPSDITVQCGEEPGNAPNISATDNCDSNVEVEFTQTENNSGDCSVSFDLVRTWIAIDDCGNSAIATQTITVEGDNTAPVLAGVPTDQTIDCGDVNSIANSANVTVTDNCDSNVDIEFIEINEPGQCGNNFTLVRTWIAIDDCGNSAVGSQRISVGDDTAPVLVGVPADVSLECGNVPSTNNVDVSATDNCDANVQVEFAEVRSELGCVGAYILTRTWTATDDCGNSSSASQIVTVGDNTAPVISGVPSDLTVECGNIPDIVEVATTDNCDDNVSVTVDELIEDGGCSNNFVVVRTYTAIDNCGNEAVSVQRIVVEDNVAPVLSGIPTDIDAECDDAVVGEIPTVTATDNCDADVNIELIEEVIASNCGSAQSLIRTWIATDNCGNSSVGTQRINIGDNTAPVLAGAPSDLTVDCGNVPNAPQVTATDNCDNNVQVELLENQTAGSCAGSYTLTRTWIATDECGNSTSSLQTITVEDIIAPVLSGMPSDISLGCDEIVDLGAVSVTATDNCDPNVVVSLEEVRTDSDCANSYVLVRTWIATDACGNSTSASQTITVGDNAAPILVGVPTSITIECDEVPSTAGVTAMDDCDTNVEVSVEEINTPGACENEFTLTRTYTATDDCGNSSTATQVITVRDNTDPILAGVPNNLTVNLNVGESIPAVADVSATDNCDSDVEVEFTEVQTSGCTFVITRTWIATDNCGNAVTATQEIMVIGDFDITINPTGVEVCAGESVPFTVLPTLDSYTYSWTATGGNFDNASSATPVYTMMAPGTYTITLVVEDQNSGCQSTVNTTVTIITAPNTEAGNNGPLCVGQTLELTSSAGANSYVWSGPNGFTSNEQNPVINNITLDNDGQYTVVADFGNGCVGNASTLVSVSESLDITIENNAPVCEGEDIILSVSGGNSFSWSGPNGFTSNLQTVIISNANLGLHTGAYTVTVTSGAGCETVLSTDVQIDRFPTATASSNSPVCSGGTLELDADGGITYQWTGPNGFASTLQNPIIDNVDLDAGIYTYTVAVFTDAGCVASTDIIVEIIGDISAIITGESSVCENETITLTATGGVEYEWIGPNGFTASGATITIDQASMNNSGTYTVTVTTAERCSATTSFDVNVLDCGCDADTWVEFTQDENCDDENGVAVLAPSTYMYTWSDGGTGSVREDLPNGTYTVTVVDPNGCDAILTVIIEESGICDECVAPAVNNTIIVQATCGEGNGGATVVVANDPSKYTYTWIPNIGTSNDLGNEREDLTAGSYEVIISDPRFDDCFTKVNFVVPNADGPTVEDIVITDAVCNASNGSATLLPSPYLYMWTHDGFIGNSRNDLLPGTYEVAVIDADNPNCPTIITVIIGNQSDFEAEANVDVQPDCGSANGIVTVNVISNGSGNYSYSWSDGGTGMTRSDLAGGLYLVIVTDNLSGCSTELMFLLLDDVATANISVSDGFVSCAGSTDGMVDIQLDLPTDFVLPANQLITNQDGFTFTNGNLPAGSYCVMITDGNGCVAGEDCFIVETPDAINIEIVSSNMTCTNDGSITLNILGGNAPYTFDWADLPGTSNIEDRFDLQAGEYSVTVTDAEGCSSSMNDINISDDCTIGCVIPNVLVDVTPSSCGGFTGEILLTLDADVTEYNFDWEGNISSGVSATGLGAGTYNVTVSRANDENCNTELTIIVTNSDGPIVTVGNITNATCDAGGTTSLAPNTLNFNWSDGGAGSDRNNLMPGTFSVTATDLATNCSSVIAITIGNGCAGGCVDIPTIAVSTVDASCGNSDGSATVVVTGSATEYMFIWTDNISTTDMAANLAAGSYGVTAVDVDNPACRAIGTVLIGNEGATDITVASNVSATCNNADGTVTLSPSDLTYDWSDNGSGSTRTDLLAGTYTVIGTNGQGCATTITLTVVEDCGICVPPTVDDVITNSTCGNADGMIELTSNIDAIYAWSPNVSSTNIASDLTAGIYEVEVISLLDPQCNNIFTFAVNNEDGPQVAVISLAGASCENGGSVTLAPADATFAWSDGVDTGDMRDDILPGDYSVTATDANGCTNVISVSIPDNCDPTSCVNPVADINLTEATCGNADGAISIATDREVVFTWSPMVSDSSTASNITAGLYSVTIADRIDQSCFTTLSIMLTNSNGPVAQIEEVTNATCNELGSVTLSGDATNTYTWFDNMMVDTRNDLAPGDYVVTITNDSGCENMIQVTVGDDCVVMPCEAPLVDPIVTESTCGNADGAITLNVAGDVIFTWTPNVSNSNEASSLAAGSYNVVVANAIDPSCSTTLDVIVRNSDGPEVTVLSVVDSDCPIDGSIILGPAVYTYTWDDGFVGNERTDLPAGTYTGTVADTTGCTNTYSVTVGDICNPAVCNAPILTADIMDATCGNADGAISITVEGTADVTFSWTPTLSTDDNLTNIEAGLYTVLVSNVDDPTCSTELAILVSNSDGPMASISSLTNADCNTTGTVSLAPDTLIYSWVDSVQAAVRTDLPAGAYAVTVSNPADSAGCTNIVQVIIEDDCPVIPPNNCDAIAGNLDIDLSPVCLSDSIATISATPLGNSQVPAGFSTLYVLTSGDDLVIEQVNVDPIFDVDTLGTFRIHTLVFDPSTLDLAVVQFGTTTASDVNALLVQGGGNTCASLDLLGASTLLYDCGDCEARAGSLTMTVDPIICVDSTTANVVLTATPDGNQVVPDGFELAYILTSTTSFLLEDVNTDPEFTITSELGIYTIHAFVYDTTLVDLDSLDLSGNTQVFALNSLLLQGGGTICGELDLGGAMVTLESCTLNPTGGCTVELVDADVVDLQSDDCDSGADFCLPMAFLDVTTSYEITVNGDVVTEFVGCDYDTTYHYSLFSLIPDTLEGPYSVDTWMVGDTSFTGIVNNVNDLVAFMNANDTLGQWSLDTLAAVVVGGAQGVGYGTLELTDTIKNLSVELDLNKVLVPNGTSVEVAPGANTVVITELATGCSDSVIVNVNCSLPNPVMGDTLFQTVVIGEMDVICIDFDSLTTIATFVNDCDANISPAVDFMILDSTTCVQYTGDAIGLDTACLIACDTLGVCDTTILIVEVLEQPSNDLEIIIEVNADSIVCLDTDLVGPIDTVFNACPTSADGNAEFMIDSTECINILGLTEGVDTACIVICSNFVCDTINITVTVIPEGGILPPVAVNNDTMTVINTPVTVNVILNDTLNTTEQGTIEILDDPLNGTASVTADNEVIYTPDPSFCGQLDSFTYVLTTIGGADTATVTVNVLCEELTVFNGFSPNGDDVNDTFTILGIERFPNADVYVYNRWGNQVYFRNGGYQNVPGIAFDGTWDGSDLPDGTYFYMIDTNDGERITGYVQIHR